jgi:hypothetical protein
MAFAVRALRDRWDEATALWDDKVAGEFEKNHLDPLERQADSAARGMDKIAEILQKVRQECS